MAKRQDQLENLSTFLQKMTSPKARLCFLSFPEAGVTLLNLQYEERDVRVEITHKQLAGLVLDGVKRVVQQ